jgi:DNA polymerase-3 subunit epsilon
MRFVAFDLETTGIVSAVDQIIEIGAVKFNGNEVESIFSTLIEPTKPIPPAATAVNGITNDMVQGKPKIEQILQSFTEFCDSLPLVAHNASFDSQFLINDYKKYDQQGPRGTIIDTLSISRKVFPGLPNYKLGTLVNLLKIESSQFHRAEADATYCGNLFVELLKRISVGGQPPSLQNLIALTGKPEFKFPVLDLSPKQMNLFA